MNISGIFYDRTNRLRSGWRAGVFLMLFIPFFAALSAVVYPISGALSGTGTMFGTSLSFAAATLPILIPAVLVGWFCGRVLERLPFRSLGASFTGKWLSHFALGGAFGGITLVAAAAIAAAGGDLSFSLSAKPASSVITSLLLSLFVFAIAAAEEEVLFRGYLLQTFARSGLAWPAVLGTSVLFGAAHAGNPDVGRIAVLNTILAGVWFGVAYLKTRDLWFVWGLHLAWNWTQGSVFGIEVSGLTSIARFPLLVEADAGPDWLTGGSYGLEGSVACSVALCCSILVVHFLPIKADPEMCELTQPTKIPDTAT